LSFATDEILRQEEPAVGTSRLGISSALADGGLRGTGLLGINLAVAAHNEFCDRNDFASRVLRQSSFATRFASSRALL
jgi:hypothetical protein